MIELHLAAPPEVVNVGAGIHGVRKRRDVFRLPDLWQLHVYNYTAELTLDGTAYTVAPGYVSITPAGASVQFDYLGRSEHLYAHFRPQRVGSPSHVPAVQDATANAPLLSTLLRSAIESSPSGSGRTTAEVWTALWRIADLTPATTEAGHPAVAAAIAYIEANLAQPLTVPALARLAGVSHNHLTRLFQHETGHTVIAYIRTRRMNRARHLLVSSTLSIPAVAASVGISDLQAFNKTCHRELGASPRAVRNAVAGVGSGG
ncbi:AraC family transcriptional regulator [Kribbella sp. NBC_00709]|uniref:AraC family transcriptional regulator n=1 Tax=Kribbella sp. NBC_00709 TaxID=2975972 RepID=UPI002E28FEE6|nr:AraC family transcriptional regulator [Kribbella sp. NBC_00709]